MKKILLLACSLGALLACNRQDVAGPVSKTDFPTVNEATTGTIPVHLCIRGGVMTKATSANDKESEIANVRLTVKGISHEEEKTLYTDTYDVSGSADVIINLTPCDYAVFTVESGNVKDGKMLTDLADQKTHYYAKGEIQIGWSDLQAEGATHVIELVRQINKVTIDKISVDWENSNYAGKEFRLKRIYLSDVPRYPESSYAEVTESLYKQAYGGTKVAFSYCNFNGLEEYTYKASNYNYISDVHRLDDQLLDEVDALISEGNPYLTQHTFYTYLCNNTNTVPERQVLKGDIYGYLPPMTTIVLEAEIDGTLMYYRFPVLKSSDTVPVNTHIKFRELVIKDLGSPTLYGDKTFENVSFSLVDWTEDDRTDATENI